MGKTTYSLIQRHKSRGIKTWYIRTCTNGVSSYKSTGTCVKADAMRLFAQMANDENRDALTLKDLNIREEFERFMDTKEAQFGGKKTNSYSAYRKSVNRFYKYLVKTSIVSMAQMTSVEAQRFVSESNRIYSPRTTIEDVKICRMAYRKTMEAYDILARNPFDKLILPINPQRMVEFWTDDEVATIIDHAPDKYWKAFWGMMAYAGLRFFEAQGLRCEDVSEERIRIVQGKMRKDAIVPISKKLSALLVDAMDGRTEGRILEGRVVKNGKQCVQRLRKAVAAAGLSNCGTISNHRFRHSFASNLLRKGVNIKVVQTLGRWSSTAVLMRHYAGVITDDLRDAVELL